MVVVDNGDGDVNEAVVDATMGVTKPLSIFDAGLVAVAVAVNDHDHGSGLESRDRPSKGDLARLRKKGLDTSGR